MDELDDILQDRHLTPLISLKMIKTFCEIRQVLKNGFGKTTIKQPVYLFCGNEDRITPTELTLSVFGKYKFEDKKVKVFDKGGFIRLPSINVR